MYEFPIGETKRKMALVKRKTTETAVAVFARYCDYG